MKRKKTDRGTFDIRGISLETHENEGKLYVSGLIPFESRSFKLPFIEIIRKGAFSKTIKEADIRALWNHDISRVCGRNKAGTLSLEEKENGLSFEIELPDTSWAPDLYKTIQRRDADGVSFGFEAVKDRWTYDSEKKETIRELLEVKLFEVSVGVAFPAYPEAFSSATTREYEKTGIDLRVIENNLVMKKYKNDYICTEEDSIQIRSIIDELKSLVSSSKNTNPESRTSKTDKPDISTYRDRELTLLEMESDIKGAYSD